MRKLLFILCFFTAINLQAQTVKSNAYFEPREVIGQIYDSTDNVTALVTTGYRTLNGFVVNKSVNTSNTDSTITVSLAGYYMISYHVSFSFDVVSKVIHASLFCNDVEVQRLEMERKIGTANDVGNMGNSAVVYVPANCVLKIKATTDGNGNMTRTHETFSVVKL